MFVKNTETTINITLQKTANATYQALANYDLSIEKPDKTIVYDDNLSTGNAAGVSAAAITPPNITTEGLLTFKYIPATKGLHKLTISHGVADNYTVLGVIRMAVIEPAVVATLSMKLPQ